LCCHHKTCWINFCVIVGWNFPPRLLYFRFYHVLWSFWFVGIFWMGLFGALQCSIVVSMPQMIPMYMSTWTHFQFKKHNQFCRNPSSRPRKLGRDDNSGSRHANLQGCIHANWKLFKRFVCFKNHLLLGDSFEFKDVIIFLYGKQQSLTMQGHVPSPQVWVVA
jgi:hypothetical protein